MAKKNKKVEEESAQSVGDWIVTFSDCMTLLLCFFVLLLTFSSFDEEAMKRFGGMFDYDLSASIIQDRNKLRDSAVEPQVHMMDRAREGSEKPTEEYLNDPGQPEQPPESNWIADRDAYRDRKIIHVPSERLFVSGGMVLTADGRKCLSEISRFMKMLPCRVVISESSAGFRGPGQAHWKRVGLSRAWEVMAHLTGQEGLAQERFNISASHQVTPKAGAVVELVLLAGKIYQ